MGNSKKEEKVGQVEKEVKNAKGAKKKAGSKIVEKSINKKMPFKGKAKNMPFKKTKSADLKLNTMMADFQSGKRETAFGGVPLKDFSKSAVSLLLSDLTSRWMTKRSSAPLPLPCKPPRFKIAANPFLIRRSASAPRPLPSSLESVPAGD